ncbi:MAG: hypothetical protein OXL68_06050 [Paracoccaceae bacterium]|nr:hypothetical protein [Paracoccaceae bacterium]
MKAAISSRFRLAPCSQDLELSRAFTRTIVVIAAMAPVANGYVFP